MSSGPSIFFPNSPCYFHHDNYHNFLENVVAIMVLVSGLKIQQLIELDCCVQFGVGCWPMQRSSVLSDWKMSVRRTGVSCNAAIVPDVRGEEGVETEGKALDL